MTCEKCGETALIAVNIINDLRKEILDLQDKLEEANNERNI